jgi:nucleoside-diphosphate-sugar epimerase
MTEKVLVTGAAGYLGSVLCEHLLREGYSVLAVDNFSHGQSSLFHLAANPNFQVERGDVRNPELMETVLKSADIIIPLAAIVGAPACAADPELATALNLESIRLMNRLRSDAQLVVYPNTNSGYGIGNNDEYCTEDTPLNPISLYGKTKVQAEHDLLDSPNAIALRLATVFGTSPRMRVDLLVNNFTHEAVTRGYILLYEKHFKRNFIHIRDIADCFIHAIQNQDKMVGRPFNAGLDDANLSKEELALKIKEYVPNFQILSSDVGHDPDQRNYIVSNERLRGTGFVAKRGLDEGIQELIKAYKMFPRDQFSNV